MNFFSVILHNALLKTQKSGQTAVVCPPDVGKRSDKIILLYKQKDQEQQELKKKLRQDFEQKNQALYAQKEHQIELLQNLKNSSVYKNFHENEEWKPSTKDWEELFQLINAIYPSFAQKLQEAYPKILIQMERLCYLVRIHVKPSRLSMLLNHSNISVLRKRLYLKMSGKTGKASDFDLYINDL